MMRVVLTERSQEDLRRIDQAYAQRVLKKLAFFVRQENSMRFARRITDPRLGMYRFRVGDYRILFDVARDGTVTVLLILTIKHRRDAYNV